jgi:hypothetical protein
MISYSRALRQAVELTILPLRDANREIVGMAAILRDVTTRFEEMQRLQRSPPITILQRELARLRIPATSTESLPGRPEHGATGYPYLVTGGEKGDMARGDRE